MTDQSITADEGSAHATQRPTSFSIGVFIIFAMMLAMVVISVSYAVSMIGFLGDGGYFLSYASLCGTVPIVAAIDQYVPFVIAGAWLVCLWLGVTRSPAFRRVTGWTGLSSLIYGAADTILGPFTFRVGPADFDPDTATCGRWPRTITDNPDLQVMQIDWLGVPISVFALSLIFLSLTILIYLRVSRRARAIYGR